MMDLLAMYLRQEYLRLQLDELLLPENIIRRSKEALEEETKKTES